MNVPKLFPLLSSLLIVSWLNAVHFYALPVELIQLSSTVEPLSKLPHYNRIVEMIIVLLILKNFRQCISDSQCHLDIMSISV